MFAAKISIVIPRNMRLLLMFIGDYCLYIFNRIFLLFLADRVIKVNKNQSIWSSCYVENSSVNTKIALGKSIFCAFLFFFIEKDSCFCY